MQGPGVDTAYATRGSAAQPMQVGPELTTESGGTCAQPLVNKDNKAKATTFLFTLILSEFVKKYRYTVLHKTSYGMNYTLAYFAREIL